MSRRDDRRTLFAWDGVEYDTWPRSYDAFYRESHLQVRNLSARRRREDLFPISSADVFNSEDLPLIQDGTRADTSDVFSFTGSVEHPKVDVLSDGFEYLLLRDIHDNLATFYSELQSQLVTCEPCHTLLLQLTGFCYEDSSPSQTSVHLYINPRHSEHDPMAWVPLTADFKRNLDAPIMRRALCRCLAEAEKERTSLRMSIETQDRNNKTSQDAARRPESLRMEVEGHMAARMALRKISLTRLIELRTSRTQDDKEPLMLNMTTKYQLCLNMATSKLFLTSPPWRQVRWCNEDMSDTNCFFLYDSETKRIENVTEPHLRCPIGSTSSHSHLMSETSLFELAKLLIEVRLWENLQLPLSNYDRIQEELTQIIDHHPDLLPGEAIKDAVRACFSDEWEYISSELANPDSKLPFQEVAEFFFEEIIQPIAQNVLVESIVKPSREMATTVDERLCEPLRQLPLERSPGPGGTEARNFMKRMNEFTGSYVKNLGTKSLPEGRNKRVRIAIIDSGVSRRDWDVREYIRLGRIADQRNFCSPRAPASDGYQGAHSKDVEDFHGHGTAVAKIALEVAPKADIYIAKVTNSENISAGELTNIFEAIIWAVEVWDVDIINLSLALDELSEEIDEALCAAFDQGNKIVFAAAHRNTGVNDEPTWPGTRAGVIPIYCTDGNGHAQGMNPKAEGVYFGTLGCDIPIRENFGSPARLAYGYASGASYATPIAAGIAANMLEIVRHTVAISRNGQALRRRYYTTNYMERLFRELNRPKEGCCFVEPWTFWRKTIRGNFQFQDRMLNKNDQRNISKVLELLASSS